MKEDSEEGRVCEEEKESTTGISLRRDSLLSILNAVNYNVI